MGVTTATLYSYVSRGRIGRTLGSDGRSSLFDLAEVDALVAASTRPVPPPPTLDVRISTSITQLDERELRYRQTRVDDLVDEPFERVCALLWQRAPDDRVTTPRLRAATPTSTSTTVKRPLDVLAIIRLATEVDPCLGPIDAATELLGRVAVDGHDGSADASFAERITRRWIDDPAPELVRAVNSALVLLADHGLATSTLAVRVATSVRASPISALIAGLATVQGDLHGAESSHAHRLLVAIERDGADAVLADDGRRHQRVAGFGHKIYRDRDPRFELLLDRVRALPDPTGRLRVVESTIRTAAVVVGQPPNIDLALAALAYVAGLPEDQALFAIARIAGWTAHHLEELDEAPLRFRGLAD